MQKLFRQTSAQLDIAGAAQDVVVVAGGGDLGSGGGPRGCSSPGRPRTGV